MAEEYEKFIMVRKTHVLFLNERESESIEWLNHNEGHIWKTLINELVSGG